MADDSARIEISAGSSQLDAGLRDAAAKMNRWALGISGTMARVGSLAKPLGQIGVGALRSVGDRAVDVIADQARGMKDFEGDLTRLGIAGSLNVRQLDHMREAAMKASTAYGINKQEIQSGAQTYVDLTGDIQGAAESMAMFGKVSAASGASTDDISKASAAYRGVGVELGQLEDIFSGLITQGKKGAVSLKDFAGELSGILPRWAKFKEGSSIKGLAEMGAVFQVARQGFGSASEAATGMQALMGALTQNAQKFEAAGVQIFDKNPKTGVKTLRSFEQIMASIEKSKLVKDPTLMTKALGSKEAEQTVTMLLKARQAIEGQASAYDELVAAGGNVKTLNEDLDAWMKSGPGQWNQMMESLKNSIAEAFTPERIQAFLDIVIQLGEGIGAVVDKISEIKDSLTGKSDWQKNPFDKDLDDRAITVANMEDVGMADLMGGGDVAADYVVNKQDRARKALQEAAKGTGPASLGAQNALAYESHRDAIMNAKGRNDRIRAAVEAANATGPGMAGARKVGDEYLKSEGISKDRIDKELEAIQEQQKQSKELKDAIAKMGADVVAAIQGKSDVYIDANKATAALGNSTNARGKVR